MVINNIKYTIIIFSKKKHIHDIPLIILDNQTFDIVLNYKYLGNILTYNLDNVLDVHSKLNNSYSTLNEMYRKFNSVNIDILMYLFNSYCVPQYGLPLSLSHNYFNKKYIKSFEIAYNNALNQ